MLWFYDFYIFETRETILHLLDDSLDYLLYPLLQNYYVNKGYLELLDTMFELLGPGRFELLITVKDGKGRTPLASESSPEMQQHVLTLLLTNMSFNDTELQMMTTLFGLQKTCKSMPLDEAVSKYYQCLSSFKRSLQSQMCIKILSALQCCFPEEMSTLLQYAIHEKNWMVVEMIGQWDTCGYALRPWISSQTKVIDQLIEYVNISDDQDSDDFKYAKLVDALLVY